MAAGAVRGSKGYWQITLAPGFTAVALRPIMHKMATLLEQVESDPMERRETLRLQTREQLRAALRELAPGEAVYVFCSLTQPYKFHARSDVDIAFLEERGRCSQYQIICLIEEHLHRPVDVLILYETRLKDKIQREGELWTG